MSEPVLPRRDGRGSWQQALLIFGLQLILALAFWSYAPMVDFFREDLSLSAAQLALIPVFLEGAGLALAPLAGWWVDRASSTVVARVLLSSTVLGLLIAGGGGHFTIILLGLSFVGMSFVAVGPMTNRMLAISTAPNRLGIAYSLKQSSVTIGMLLSALLLPPISTHWGWRAALLFAATVTAVLGGIIVWRLKENQPQVATGQDRSVAFRDFRLNLSGSLRSPTMRSMFAIGFVFQGITYSFMTFFVPFVIDSDGLSVSRAVALLAAIQAVAIVTRPALGWLSDVWRAPNRTYYLAALAAFVGVLMIVSCTPLPPWLHVALLVLGGASAFAWIGVYFARLAELSNGQGLGFATGVALIPIKLGGMGIPLAMGLLIDHFSYRAAFTASGIALMLCACHWWWLLVRADRPARINESAKKAHVP